nr:MAG TPA: hypothetical protein [Caudoviricetes sp.]
MSSGQRSERSNFRSHFGLHVDKPITLSEDSS